MDLDYWLSSPNTFFAFRQIVERLDEYENDKTVKLFLKYRLLKMDVTNIVMHWGKEQQDAILAYCNVYSDSDFLALPDLKSKLEYFLKEELDIYF